MPRSTASKVLEIESQAILDLRERLDASFDRAADLILATAGRVVLTGMGKSGIIAQKISATFSSTGTPSLYLHPAEAVHGDIGRIVAGDTVLAISNSGETEEILLLLPIIKRLATPLLAMTGDARSALASSADVHIDVSVSQEACPLGLAPTASTTAALAMGDALAMAVLEKRGFTVDDFATLHPAGRLGRKLLRVADVMHKQDEIPKVRRDARMRDVLFVMTAKRLGMTTVVDEADHLAGVISDGDLRRQMERHGHAVFDRTAEECMTRTPVLIGERELATQALNLMEARKITALVVVAADSRVIGVIHLHDLWRTELV
ncbi:MAG: KpsF/GutQ family sugar-phosphate isomerase [Vicinamibacteria bacterium]|nr:KpsF/GutQ family sugar-phosphate isomerase [Vicinamibacteria bacterium]